MNQEQEKKPNLVIVLGYVPGAEQKFWPGTKGWLATGLSLQAWAILQWLCECSPTFHVTNSGVFAVFHDICGRDAIRAKLNELKKSGHLAIMKKADGSGESIWIASPMPLFNPDFPFECLQVHGIKNESLLKSTIGKGTKQDKKQVIETLMQKSNTGKHFTNDLSTENQELDLNTENQEPGLSAESQTLGPCNENLGLSDTYDLSTENQYLGLSTENQELGLSTENPYVLKTRHKYKINRNKKIKEKGGDAPCSVSESDFISNQQTQDKLQNQEAGTTPPRSDSDEPAKPKKTRKPKPKHPDERHQVMEHLNQARSQFNLDPKPLDDDDAQKIDNAIESGYTVDDLNLIIDSKANEWQAEKGYISPGHLFEPRGIKKKLDEARDWAKRTKPAVEKPLEEMTPEEREERKNARKAELYEMFGL